MKRKKHIATILLGIIAAIVVLVGQVNYYPAQVKAMKVQEADMDESQEDGKQEQLRIFSNDAVSTVVGFNFQHVLHFITEIYSEAVQKVWVRVEEKLIPLVYFETLFQRIISPNAP